MAYKPTWDDIEIVLRKTKRVIIRGVPGVGKTTTPILAAHKDGLPFYTVTLTEDMSPQECVGHWMPKGGGHFEWHDGPFAMAWRGNGGNGGVLIINEITKASGSVLTELYNFLDDESIAYKTLPSGEMIKPGKDFRVVATTNDPFDLLPEALYNRFEGRFEINKPHPDATKRLPEPFKSFVERCYEDDNSDVTLRDVYALVNLISKDVNPRVAAASVFHDKGDDILAALSIGKREETSTDVRGEDDE